MNKVAALFVATAIGAVASPALAQDGDATFTGPRAGIVLGYDITQAGSSVDADNEPGNNDQSIDGIAYGAQVGYDFDLGGVVLGIEGEYTDSTAKTDFEDGDFEGFGFGRVDAGRDMYVGARLGAKVSPDVLAYVKGGYTNYKLNVLSNDGTVETDRDFKLDGWRAGAGIEYAINENTYMNLEYRYSNYEEGEVVFPSGSSTSDFNVDLDRHQVAVGLGMRF